MHVVNEVFSVSINICYYCMYIVACIALNTRYMETWEFEIA